MKEREEQERKGVKIKGRKGGNEKREMRKGESRSKGKEGNQGTEEKEEMRKESF